MLIRERQLKRYNPKPNPAAAAAIQELMGGKFGEMSTLMNFSIV